MSAPLAPQPMEYEVSSQESPHPTTASSSRMASQAATTFQASTGSPRPAGRQTNRILCPVVGCLEASISSNKHFRDFASIKGHLNDHCTGYLTGAVPISFLTSHGYTQCQICDKVIHKKFRRICPRCKPTAREQEQMNTLRNQINPQNNDSAAQQHSHQAEDNKALPSLSDIHEKFVPVLKNIPPKARRLWSQCLTKSIAQALWTNSVASWTELQMLPKRVLCRPSRGGGSHASKKLAWTMDRLQRWLSGERAELWHDLPKYKQPKPKNLSAESIKTVF